MLRKSLRKRSYFRESVNSKEVNQLIDAFKSYLKLIASMTERVDELNAVQTDLKNRIIKKYSMLEDIEGKMNENTIKAIDDAITYARLLQEQKKNKESVDRKIMLLISRHHDVWTKLKKYASIIW